MSDLLNKAKEALSGHKKVETYDNARSTNEGPHSSNVTDKANPRVDSDRDHRNDPTSRIGGHGSTQAYSTTTGPGYGGTTTGAGYGTTGTPIGPSYGTATHGPHSSKLANKAGPRVDGDIDGSRTIGGSTTYGGSHMTSTAGPHSSNLANKADPRVDSGLDRSRTVGGTGVTGHSAAPDHAGSTTTLGSGNTNKTAGPHGSDLMNKLDPRVDSDMDGSKTYGGNMTHY